ncbi:MAG: translation initiation factor IF-2 [Candidatus Pacebacteria bacterium]|nr:translation initiation factor IF-2 [Candidatus Paceibacterota bacterium]
MKTPSTQRPPVVAIMGHIDHGKSTLLDYIRKTNVVGGEAGGITQHLSAYEISVPYQKETRVITFLDTPGHAAFTGMRERGASAADIAILVVSAEDGVKAQTIEALKTIREAKIPFIVAINKIDLPESNIEKTKLSLAESEILVEGFGGDIPWVPISATKGTGIPDLLETIILVADLAELSSDAGAMAEGVVIESHLEPKRGIAATLIIKNGTLKRSQFVVAGDSFTTTRIMENFLGKTIESVPAGTSVHLIGFDKLPEVGAEIVVFDKKKDAEKHIAEFSTKKNGGKDAVAVADGCRVVPLIIKTDVQGTLEAIEKEINKISIEGLHIKIIGRGIGSIGEADIKLAQSDKNTIILGFNSVLDKSAKDINEKVEANIQSFDIIYKLTEYLEEELEKRRPRIETREVIGTAKVLKTFSHTRERQVLGARVESGTITHGAKVSVIRREFPLAEGKVVELQQARQKQKEVSEGECGLMIECKKEIAVGDILEAFIMVTK